METQTAAAAAKAPSAVFTGVKGITITEAAVKAHIMEPPQVRNLVSSRGLEEGIQNPIFRFPPAPAYHLDVNGFGQALHNAIKNLVAGYVMRLRQNGKTIYTLEWNFAKEPVDGAEGWSSDVRMHVASCSKLITAMAMTKLLNDKRISYDTPIGNFLPNYWDKGPNINKITFRNLMTHTSGFNSGTSNSDYPFMKAEVAAGVTDLGQYHYQNMNFGLCRILISTINGNIAPAANFSFPFFSNWNDIVWDFVTILAYSSFVNAHVFAPAGVSGPTLDHPAPDALAYQFPVNGNGWNSGNLSTMSGGAGWHMSVDDLLNVMGAFRRKGTIMTRTQAQLMLDDGFGIDVNMSTPIGRLYNKNGLWEDGSGHVEQSLAYFLPENMELVVLANSPIGSPAQFFRDFVTNIYMANIKP
jgi:CubicO group peptidase (beta-lactamase class C family)